MHSLHKLFFLAFMSTAVSASAQSWSPGFSWNANVPPDLEIRVNGTLTPVIRFARAGGDIASSSVFAGFCVDPTSTDPAIIYSGPGTNSGAIETIHPGTCKLIEIDRIYLGISNSTGRYFVYAGLKQ